MEKSFSLTEKTTAKKSPSVCFISKQIWLRSIPSLNAYVKPLQSAKAGIFFVLWYAPGTTITSFNLNSNSNSNSDAFLFSVTNLIILNQLVFILSPRRMRKSLRFFLRFHFLFFFFFTTLGNFFLSFLIFFL